MAQGHRGVVAKPDDEVIVGARGPATLCLAEPRRTAAASIRIDEFFTARAPLIGGHAVLATTRSNLTCLNVRSRVSM